MTGEAPAHTLAAGVADSPPDPSLADQVWMLQQEFRTFAARVNEHEIERIIDVSVPVEWLRGHLARYDFAMPAIAGKRVLDMACGTGYGSNALAARGSAASILGADVDPDAVRYARLRYRRPNLRYVTADACERWTDELFDVIISWETIEHVPAPDRMLESVTHMLQPGGVFYVSTPIRVGGHITDRPANPYHVREWSQEEFEQLLQQYFARLEWYVQGVSLPKRLLGVRTPTSVMRWLYQRRGYQVRHYYFTDPSVRDPRALPPGWLETPPQVLVGVCREPRQPDDAALVRKLVYG